MMVVVCFRFLEEDARLVQEISRSRGEDFSSFVRRAVYKAMAELGYLDEKRRKALGVIPEVGGVG